MYTQEKRNLIKDIWRQFKVSGIIDKNNPVLRSEIADSWERCKGYGVNFLETETPMVSPEKFKAIYESKQELLTVAEPYIQNLYEVIAGTKSYICITDENGVVLSSFYDESIISVSEETFPLPGRILNEESTGTNAIGTCLFLNKPFYVLGEEHYKISSHTVSCFSALIHNEKQEIIGLINISGLYEETDVRLLALITAATGAIEREIRLLDAYKKLSQSNILLQTIINSISDGALLLDDKNFIIHANNNALKILSIEKSNLIRMNINDIIPNSLQWNKIFLERKIVENQEILFHHNNKLYDLVASIYPCEDSLNTVSHKVVILKEMKNVRKLINKMTGSSANYTFHSIICNSNEMKHVIELAKKAAGSDSTVLLRGESGTGKEMFAQAIHNAGSKKHNPFIAINCGALPRGLIESELFGYEGGTFTGSKKEGHMGKFELAEGGTIFFDEIGDMPLDLQTTLLRVLQNREVTRIGGTSSKQINVRIIAATNCDLEDKVRNRAFREDLYYRLNVFPIFIPPLRVRSDDIAELARHFAKKYCFHFGMDSVEFSSEAIYAITNYQWPGNVRELENAIERAVNIDTDNILDINDLPSNLTYVGVNEFIGNSAEITEKKRIDAFFDTNKNNTSSIAVKSEYEDLIKALTVTRGNVKDAAAILNTSYRSVYRRIEKYNIDKKIFKNLPLMHNTFADINS
jgi:transcriptional regulator of acetoin/glycerol metabolism